MKESAKKALDNLIARYPSLWTCREDIEKTFEILKNCFLNGGKLLLVGNGGSSADADHFSAELLKKFRVNRPIEGLLKENLKDFGSLGEDISQNIEGGFPVISLTSFTALSTAFSNDNNGVFTFSQLLSVLGNKDDVLFVFSTSANSQNCLYASILGKAKRMKVSLLTGENEGKIRQFSDAIIAVPQTETNFIQELHLPVYHALAEMLENEFYAD